MWSQSQFYNLSGAEPGFFERCSNKKISLTKAGICEYSPQPLIDFQYSTVSKTQCFMQNYNGKLS